MRWPATMAFRGLLPTAISMRSSSCAGRAGPGSARGAGTGPARGILARHLGREDHLLRPVQGVGHQCPRRGHRLVVLGQGPHSRREHPGRTCQMDSRCGSRPPSPARFTTSPPPASTPCPRSTRPPRLPCPPWPIPVMRAPASASSSLSNSPPGVQELDINTRTRNAIQRSLRCLGERGFALLTGRWRTLQHITASPSKIGDIAAPRSSSPISSTATSPECGRGCPGVTHRPASGR